MGMHSARKQMRLHLHVRAELRIHARAQPQQVALCRGHARALPQQVWNYVGAMHARSHNRWHYACALSCGGDSCCTRDPDRVYKGAYRGEIRFLELQPTPLHIETPTTASQWHAFKAQISIYLYSGLPRL